MIKSSDPVFHKGVTRRAVQAVAAGADTATAVAGVLGCTEKQVVCILDLLVERGVLTEIGNLKYGIRRRPSQPRNGLRVPSAPSVLETRDRATMTGLAGTMDDAPGDPPSGLVRASLSERLRSWWRLEDLVSVPGAPKDNPLDMGPESRWLMTLTLVTIGAVAWTTWTAPTSSFSSVHVSDPANLLRGQWAGELRGEPFFLQLSGTEESLAGAITVDMGASIPVVKPLRGTATHSDGQLIVTMIEQGTSSPYRLDGTLSSGRLVGSVKITGEESAAWWATRP